MSCKIRLLFVCVAFSISSTATFANEYVSVSIRNDSNVTASIGVQMINGQYLWKTVAPGKKYYADLQFFVYVPYAPGSQSVQVKILYNGVTRTGTLPIYQGPFGGNIYYSSGRVFRRSPGVLGLQNLGP